jgi:short-subunit dehydrogenase
MEATEWQATLETNLTGVFYCCRQALPLMKERGGGYIINIGSLAGKNAIPGMAAYCASKFGLIGFSEALMQEVRHDHIRVSYVMPGSVDTGFGGGRREGSASWKLAPEDVAEVVVDLLEMEPRALPSRVELRPSEPKS